ncbi:hypothetical protein [Aureimonas endophytica]|nr:hypothetical protein [Aureimonas endophytica]
MALCPAFQAQHGAAVRTLIKKIERPVSLLDSLDGDPDAGADGDDEPSLGWTRTMAIGTNDDAEQAEAAP